MCQSKFRGGWGLRSAREMNQALLAKLAWKIDSNEKSLFATVFRQKYCRRTDFLSCNAGSNSTWGWRGMLWGRDLLKRHLKWKIGKGDRVRVIDDWIPQCSNPLKDTDLPSSHTDMKVKDLLNASGSWNLSLLQELFPPSVLNRIISIYRPSQLSPVEDQLFWEPTRTGICTVKSGYYTLIHDRQIEQATTQAASSSRLVGGLENTDSS
ncbi:OLC1v1011432C1 [Oldenlandia corymbosa var. corymbosa]|uniref:OLC1v1011432C1 n=1 Tax=Oldenlandia corymbosa var. corymbosa TaxID=529605 RepID=A0AAV1DWU0_OLDCO|nr:OLC1v1011432C1 [Oldenlandia corymbosa var. corymbosa]